ncbi:hypothetical protein [Hyphomicrobium sp.]|uniref:hypothetical protein n=1 Tax=Hyphomicrobium sp. TaxID=82 RepID=UPI003F72A4AB
MPPKTADSQFRSLDPEKIIGTLDLLAQRIGERFPHTGLERVSHELADIARHTSASVAAIARPNLLIRGFVAAVLATGLGLLAWLALLAIGLETSSELTNIMQGLDSATSMLLVLGGLALYLSTLESRWRRERAMKSLYELRAIIHVIDMHQLTKDPSAYGAPRMSSSPDRSMSSHQLLRYLGYCSELLSLASKVAALYADKLRDPAIVDAVGDIERLTAHLGQKIWQKIELVQQRMPSRPANDALAPKGHS